MRKAHASTTMPRTDLPIAATKGAASSRAARDCESPHPIDWRQLSHELRTPLNAILGNVELLLDGSAGPLSGQARTCIGEVQVAGRQLLRQVGLLLAWSELSAGGPRPAPQPVDLIALVREASTIECANPAQIEPQDASLLIAGDPFWLQMLVTEIVTLRGASGRAAYGQARPARRRQRARLLLVGLQRRPGGRLAPGADPRHRADAGRRASPECGWSDPALAGGWARAGRGCARRQAGPGGRPGAEQCSVIECPMRAASSIIRGRELVVEGLVVGHHRAYCNCKHPVTRNSRSAAALF